MEFRNPQWNRHGTIDVELNHPELGWIPFTASDKDPATAEVYAEALKGPIEPLAPEVIEQLRTSWQLPRLVFKAMLLEAGLLAQVDVLVQQSGDPMTILKWNEAAIFPRNDPLIDAIGPMLGLSPEAIDQMYRQGMALL